MQRHQDTVSCLRSGTLGPLPSARWIDGLYMPSLGTLSEAHKMCLTVRVLTCKQGFRLADMGRSTLGVNLYYTWGLGAALTVHPVIKVEEEM